MGDEGSRDYCLEAKRQRWSRSARYRCWSVARAANRTIIVLGRCPGTVSLALLPKRVKPVPSNSGVMGDVLGVVVTQVILHGPEVGALVRSRKSAQQWKRRTRRQCTPLTAPRTRVSIAQHIAQEPLI